MTAKEPTRQYFIEEKNQRLETEEFAKKKTSCRTYLLASSLKKQRSARITLANDKKKEVKCANKLCFNDSVDDQN